MSEAEVSTKTVGVPYKYQNPLAADEDIYIERRAQLDQAFRNLTGDRWVVVLGQPGMGRTTFLGALRKEYLDRTKLAAAMLELPSLQRTYPNPLEGFARELRNALIRSRNDGSQISPDVIDFMKKHASELRTPVALHEFLQQLVKRLPDQSLLLILDDADRAQDEARKDVFQVLRSFRDCPSREGKIQLVVSGARSSSLWQGSVLEDLSSPLTFAPEIELELFEPEDVHTLARIGSDELDIAIDEQAVNEIARLSGGVPLGVQRSLALVFEHAIAHNLDEITTSDVKDVALADTVDFSKAPALEAKTSLLADVLERQQHAEFAIGRNTNILDRNTRLLERNTKLLDELKLALLARDVEGISAPADLSQPKNIPDRNKEPLQRPTLPTPAEDGIVAPDTPGETYFLDNAEQIQRDYAEKWIAVVRSGVASHDSGFQRMMEAFNQRAVDEAPYVVFVPRNDQVRQ